MTRHSHDHLSDIRDAALRALRFVEGMSLDDFADDEKTIAAVIRQVEIVGEASKRVDPVFRDKHPEIPWNSLAKMRDLVSHEYHRVDERVVWKTVRDDYPELANSVGMVLDSIEEDAD